MQTTLASTLSVGETGSLTLATDYSSQLADVSASRPGILVVDRVDSDGDPTPNSREYIKFTGVSGTTISGLTRGQGGSAAQAHSSGAIVEFVVDADTVGSITDTFLVEHEADGTHSADIVTETGTQTLTNKTLTSPVLNTPKVGTSINDTNGNEVIKTPATSSAVNEITVTNAATGNAPVVSATGGDTNIHLDLQGKGNGLVKLAVLRQDDTTNTYPVKTVIHTGYGYIQGDNTINLEKQVSFGVTFAAAPILLVVPIGYRGSTPSGINSFDGNFANAGNIYAAGFKNESVNGFNVNLRCEVGFTFSNSRYFGYAWIAIGVLT